MIDLLCGMLLIVGVSYGVAWIGKVIEWMR